MFQLLSIDFDYFQDVDKNMLIDYPDGIDMPVMLSNLIWDSKYRYHGGRLCNVKINESLLSKAKDILYCQGSTVPVFIAESHEKAYHMVKLYVSPKEPLYISHVDMHHDCFNDNDKLDCGNWLKFLAKDYKQLYVEWYTRKVALKMYGIKRGLPHYGEQKFASLENNRYDGIFICKSSIWTPPHLDRHFAMLCNACTKHFKNTMFVPGLEIIRYIPYLQERYWNGGEK